MLRKLLIVIATLVPGAGANAQTVDATGLSEKLTGLVVEEVSAHLKDPYTAHYRLPALKGDALSKGLGAYCGYVNSKNSYGGYGGFSLFAGIIVNSEEHNEYGFVFGTLAEDEASSKKTAEFCKKHSYSSAPS